MTTFGVPAIFAAILGIAYPLQPRPWFGEAPRGGVQRSAACKRDQGATHWRQGRQGQGGRYLSCNERRQAIRSLARFKTKKIEGFLWIETPPGQRSYRDLHIAVLRRLHYRRTLQDAVNHAMLDARLTVRRNAAQ